MIANFARIEVQQPFCNRCVASIKNELQKIVELKNIRCYPKESMVTFNFIRAYELSIALNTLSEIGYPEKGERHNQKQFLKSGCHC